MTLEKKVNLQEEAIQKLKEQNDFLKKENEKLQAEVDKNKEIISSALLYKEAHNTLMSELKTAKNKYIEATREANLLIKKYRKEMNKKIRKC